jgi:hypothetical protein
MLNLKRIRTIVYPAPDLKSSMQAWSKVLGDPVYKNKDFVTFLNEDGIDIRLSRLPWTDHPVTFWEVDDIKATYAEMLQGGATAMSEKENGELEEVTQQTGADGGAGIINKPGRKLAILKLADGSLIGLLQDL